MPERRKESGTSDASAVEGSRFDTQSVLMEDSKKLKRQFRLHGRSSDVGAGHARKDRAGLSAIEVGSTRGFPPTMRWRVQAVKMSRCAGVASVGKTAVNQ